METFLRDLMVEQIMNGLDAEAIVHSAQRGSRSDTSINSENGQELRITRVARWFTLAFAPFSPTFGLALRNTIRRQRPDVLHIHMPNVSAFWCLVVPSARRIPWVVHWHSDVVASEHKLSLRLLYGLYRFPEQLLLRSAVRIISTSPPYLASSEPLAAHRDKCAVVPLGIELNAAGSEPTTAPEAPDVTKTSRIDRKLRVLTVCRLTYYKGLEYLLGAIAAVPDAELTLVGDGEDREKLLALAQALGLGDRFVHIVSCDDSELQALYASHDLFCLPSIERTEAFGVVLLESMRAGLPCLVTDVPGSGMKWVVDAPRSGYVTKAASTPALITALIEISTNRDKLKTVGIRSRVRFLEHLSIAACSKTIAGVYDQVTTAS